MFRRLLHQYAQAWQETFGLLSAAWGGLAAWLDPGEDYRR